MNKKYPSKKDFQAVSEAIEKGEQLTFEMIGQVFGTEFWMLLVLSLMDANDAARAIQSAIARIGQRTGDEVV